MSEDLAASLASVLRAARQERGWSVQDLADRAGVSRSMISKVEREESQPTAALLGRLSGALGMTLTELVARAEGDERRLARLADQKVWVDPATSYRRRAVSPPAGAATQLVEVELPAGARVPYPADSYRFVEHQIWVLDGTLHFLEGETEHVLRPGDCLQLGPAQDCCYVNPTDTACRYLVVLTRRNS
ncbi:MAG TPA: XRE family transcriptional regulator [Acidimicrobiales bacterium]|nr:XRE family transcriptional regulator [Acidimicrobiales bacterium]